MPKQKAGNRKLGRDKVKCAKYRNDNTRAKNKTVRVAKSSGYGAALEYADRHGISQWAQKRLRFMGNETPRD